MDAPDAATAELDAALLAVDAALLDAPVVVPDVSEPIDAPELMADAAQPDSPPIDAGPPDAAIQDADLSGPLTLTVYDKDQNRPSGVRVLSHDAQGKYLDSTVTGGDGKATIRVPPGGAITVATLVGDRHLLTTILAVQPGDDLAVMDVEGQPPLRGPSAGEAHVKLPGTRAGAEDYRAGSNCVPNGSVPDVLTAVVQPLDESCSAAAIDAVATAISSTPANIAFSAGSAAPVTGVATINLPPWVGATNLTVDLLNSSSTAPVDIQAGLVKGPRALANLYCSSTMSTVTCPVPATPIAGTKLRASITVYTPSGLYTNGRGLLAEVALPASMPSIDLADIPPVLGSLVVDLPSPNRPRVRWAAAGSLDDMDGGFVILAWTDAGLHDHEWLFIMPGGLSVMAPELPSAIVGDWIPNVPASALEMTLMRLGQSPGNESYSDYRQHYPDYLLGGLKFRFVRVTQLD